VTLAQGQAIGAYEIMERIGQGGMATVYKAYQPEQDRYVAIKMLHQTYLSDTILRQRFEREAQIVGGLTHAHILTVYDYAQHQDQPYLVMKLIDGVSLKAVLNKGALELDAIFRILDPIASALDYAHAQGILHRDVKPSNILLEQGITPYLTDFGLARFVMAGESSLSHDIFIGTPFYVSPEQGSGDKTLTARADLYSFGVVMYELLVGQVPYNAGTTFAVIHDHIYKPLPLPSLFNPNLTPSVEYVLVKALSKQPEERYASAAELVAALRDAVNTSGMKALKVKKQIPPGFPGAETPIMRLTPGSDTSLLPRTDTRTNPRRRLSRRVAWSAGIVLVIALIGVSLFVLRRADNRPPPPTLYSVPISNLDTARANAAANPTNPSAQLAYLRAVLSSPNYTESEQFFTSERIITNALPDMESPIIFLMSAADLARGLNKPNEAFALYAEALIRGQDSNFYEAIRATAGEYMYRAAIDPDALNPLQIRRINSNQRFDDSPLVKALIARALMNDNRLIIAEIVLSRPDVRDSAMPEIHLITGELRQADGIPGRARLEYELALNVPDAPAWITARANELIRSLN